MAHVCSANHTQAPPACSGGPPVEGGTAPLAHLCSPSLPRFVRHSFSLQTPCSSASETSYALLLGPPYSCQVSAETRLLQRRSGTRLSLLGAAKE